MWIIIGLILFLITYYIHKHTYRTDYLDKEDKCRVASPLWLILSIFILSMIPGVNIILFLTGTVVYVISYISEDITIEVKGVAKKIMDFLNKEI